MKFQVPPDGIDIYEKYLDLEHLNCKRHKGYDIALLIAYTKDKFDGELPYYLDGEPRAYEQDDVIGKEGSIIGYPYQVEDKKK